MDGEGKIVTITGLDRVGKETQSRLLTWALQPAVRVSFPDYNHWGGQIVKAILNEVPFTVDNADRRRKHRQAKHPVIFQLLQAVDRLHYQERIRATLATHHIIADRYEVDAMAYGVVDGCPLDWLLAMDRLYRNSDLAIILLGEPFPRAGETPDLNERDTGFQERVARAYHSLATLMPDRFLLMQADRWRDISPSTSIGCVHRELCKLINERLELGIRPLPQDLVEQHLEPAWHPVQQQYLSSAVPIAPCPLPDCNAGCSR
jgi:thymidylate kinase